MAELPGLGGSAWAMGPWRLGRGPICREYSVAAPPHPALGTRARVPPESELRHWEPVRSAAHHPAAHFPSPFLKLSTPDGATMDSAILGRRRPISPELRSSVTQNCVGWRQTSGVFGSEIASGDRVRPCGGRRWNSAAANM
ncbi:hypothetical protein VTN49DRAFT_8009 [Thermomyces lanuginosus]|uniref:uncharacterized protein n=1 Tax=Thermomyces lanuginosus TaxID=5541 RepID=UPI003742AF8E